MFLPMAARYHPSTTCKQVQRIAVHLVLRPGHRCAPWENRESVKSAPLPHPTQGFPEWLHQLLQSAEPSCASEGQADDWGSQACKELRSAWNFSFLLVSTGLEQDIFWRCAFAFASTHDCTCVGLAPTRAQAVQVLGLSIAPFRALSSASP